MNEIKKIDILGCLLETKNEFDYNIFVGLSEMIDNYSITRNDVLLFLKIDSLIKYLYLEKIIFHSQYKKIISRFYMI